MDYIDDVIKAVLGLVVAGVGGLFYKVNKANTDLAKAEMRIKALEEDFRDVKGVPVILATILANQDAASKKMDDISRKIDQLADNRVAPLERTVNQLNWRGHKND